MRRDQKVIATAFLANVTIAVAKAIGAAISGSASLTAEAIHSFVDTGNQILLFVGEKRARRPPTALHPLGHGREAFFWSFIVALLLFSLGGLYSIFEGIERLKAHEFRNPLLGLIILGVAALGEGFSLRTVIRRIRGRRHPVNFYTWFRRSTASELLVIFTEDTAALTGITIAACGIVLSWITHNSIWDALGSIGVGLVLVVVAVALAREIKSLIIGEAPAKDYARELGRLVGQVIPGAKVRKLVAVQIGADEVIMSYKITQGQVEEASDLVRRIGELEKKVHDAFPEVHWQFISPVT